MSEPAADLASDTAVEPLGQGRYRLDLSDRWDYRMPSGGVLMTAGLRAMVAELADEGLQPVAATTTFCAPVPPGPTEIEVVVLRRGNAAAQVRAALRAAGQQGPSLEVAGTFARGRTGPSFVNATRPPWLPPADDEPPDGWALAGEKYRFFQAVLSRPASRLRQGQEAPSGLPGSARWFRYRTPQRTRGGQLDPLALPPLADTMPPAVRAVVGDGSFSAPSLDLTVHFFEPSRADWVLAQAHSRWARDGYASACVELWGDDGVLLAFATQTMMLRKR